MIMGLSPGVIMDHVSDTAFLPEMKSCITTFVALSRHVCYGSTHVCQVGTSLNHSFCELPTAVSYINNKSERKHTDMKFKQAF